MTDTTAQGQSKADAALKDRQLERRIAAAMNERREKWLAKLSIEAQRGIVTLKGYVSSDEEKRIAAEVSARTRGVQQLHDRLVVDPTKVGKEAKPITAGGDLPWGWIVYGGGGLVAGIVALVWWATLPPAVVHVPTFAVEGKAYYQGVAMDGADFTFHPKKGGVEALRPKGKVKYDGTLKLGTYATDDGAPAGEYVVTIQWRQMVNKGGELEAGPDLVPASYNSPQTTPLTARVEEAPVNRVQFNLTR
jgi:hypothetical protein